MKMSINTLSDFIKRHQVLSFFILAYAISWITWVPFFPLFIDKEIFLAGPLIMVGIFGPAIAGIIISAILDPRSDQSGRWLYWTAFIVTWILATLILILNPNLKYDISPPILVICMMTGLVPAFIVSAAFSRFPAIRNYLSSLIHPRGGISWYVLAFLLFPALQLLGVAIAQAFDQEVTWRTIEASGSLGIASIVICTFFYQFFYANCIGEETGWRGFAQPRLQARFNPLTASMIIGFLWGVWHLPLWRAETGSLTDEHIILIIFHIINGVLFAWLYNRSKASILAVGILHTSGNVSLCFLPVTAFFFMLIIIPIIFVVVSDRMWRKVTF